MIVRRSTARLLGTISRLTEAWVHLSSVVGNVHKMGVFSSNSSLINDDGPAIHTPLFISENGHKTSQSKPIADGNFPSWFSSPEPREAYP